LAFIKLQTDIYRASSCQLSVSTKLVVRPKSEFSRANEIRGYGIRAQHAPEGVKLAASAPEGIAQAIFYTFLVSDIPRLTMGTDDFPG
jgi:hypothetical protein